MKFVIDQDYSFKPTREEGYGYSQLIALKENKAIGLSKNAMDSIFKLQIFENGNVRYLDLPKQLFTSSIGTNSMFLSNNVPVLITNKLHAIFFDKELKSYVSDKIRNSEIVFSPSEIQKGIGHFAKHSGKSINNEVILPFSYSSLSNQNQLVRLRIDSKNGRAKWVALHSEKMGWFKKYDTFRGKLDLEEFPHNFGYPVWSKPPIVYSTLNLNDKFLIYSCGDWITKGSGLSYNCISEISYNLKLIKHRFVQNHHARKDEKHWGKFGVFSTDNKFVIVT